MKSSNFLALLSFPFMKTAFLTKFHSLHLLIVREDGKNDLANLVYHIANTRLPYPKKNSEAKTYSYERIPPSQRVP